ncbi:metal ABC transporter substrate-binding protein [Halegenticoccus soli]|uniref:metal ABC transporter substrate-binding protein n=1 Tax=Halegenticoccus soli TaxID=1985678 RepID=UPI000C6DFAB3|nr:metal ABC transporter substrate-binding protein [Halegenticoccus soli]
MSGYTRRRALGIGAGVAVAAFAGCLGEGGDGSGGATGGDGEPVQASFFVLSDFADSVAGDAVEVGNLVPFGQHGHGWEPGPDIQRTVLRSDALVYMGDGFQPWADKIVQNVRDNDEDVSVIAAREDVDLLGPPGEGGDDHGHGDHEGGEHGHDDHAEDDHGHNDTAEDDHDHEAGGNETDHGHEAGGNETGGHEGGSHDEHAEESHEEHGEHGDHEGDGHDHGPHDPHFWLDPTRAATAVENVRRGLVEVYPDRESAFADNAAAYASELEALDEEFRSSLDGRERDDVLVAGHNAFQYLGNRYGFTVHALTGLAPDSQASPRDVSRAQALIEEHGITHVLAPVFESDRAAKQLVEETDATEAVPLTPVPTLKAEWAEKGWGFVDVMRNVNLPSLQKALGAE